MNIIALSVLIELVGLKVIRSAHKGRELGSEARMEWWLELYHFLFCVAFSDQGFLSNKINTAIS